MTTLDVNSLRQVIKEELKPINKRLDAQGRKLDILWDEVGRVNVGLVKIEEKLDIHTEALKRIEQKVGKSSDDILKLDKRLTKVEGHLGIAPPPELILFR